VLALSHQRCNTAKLLTAHGGPHGKARLKNIWKSPRATLQQLEIENRLSGTTTPKGIEKFIKKL